jgi:hypothetical protein
VSVPQHPTVIEQRAGKRDALFGIIIAVLVLALASPFLRDSELDLSTEIALGALALVALGMIGFWVLIRRHPSSLVVDDTEIKLVTHGSFDDRRRIERSSGALRLAYIGSARSRTLVLSSLHGDGQIPLHFFDRQDVLDACYAHGWDFGET